jgi:hypothetical protein
MSVIFRKDDAAIYATESGVEINADGYQATYRHYNVVVDKQNDLYIITAEQPKWDCFLHDEFDPEIVNKVIDDHVFTSQPMLFGLIPAKRYVRGWSEYKDRRKVTYTTNNITIKKG